jgi:ribosomal-protein-alanine N-acetyltransferase
VAIIPRNKPSRRVMEKLEIREEGLAVGFLEIDGTWEDHVRYAITDDDWWARRSELVETWLT